MLTHTVTLFSNQVSPTTSNMKRQLMRPATNDGYACYIILMFGLGTAPIIRLVFGRMKDCQLYKYWF